MECTASMCVLCRGGMKHRHSPSVMLKMATTAPGRCATLYNVIMALNGKCIIQICVHKHVGAGAASVLHYRPGSKYASGRDKTSR